MRDLVPDQLGGDGIIVVCQPLIGQAQHLGQWFQPLQHCGHRNAIVDQAGDFIDANSFELLNAQHGVLNRAEQPGIIKIPQECEIEDPF